MPYPNSSYPKLRFCLDRYRKYLKNVRSYSSHSVTSYISDLSVFEKFCQEKSGDWTQREFLTLFLKNLFKKKYAHSSIYRYRSSLSGFFEYLVKQKIISVSAMKQLGRYKQKRTPPQVWPQKKTSQVLSTLKTSLSGVTITDKYRKQRDILITEMLYGLGLRISELTKIKTNDFDFSQKMVMIKGKGGHHQVLPLTPRIFNLLDGYLKTMETFLAGVNCSYDHGMLFCNYRGSPITVRGIRYAFQNRLITNQIGRIHPHALRHSLAGHLLENGAGIREVQRVLRHRSIATTQIYTQVSSYFLKTQYQKKHPLANLSESKSSSLKIKDINLKKR